MINVLKVIRGLRVHARMGAGGGGRIKPSGRLNLFSRLRFAFLTGQTAGGRR